MSTSDRRLKASITPLYRTLVEQGKLPTGNSEFVSRSEAVDWVLRELRPVSFVFRDSPRGEVRFGFVAQELERALPNLVRTDAQDTKAMIYQDLIAVLALGVQEHHQQLEDTRQRLGRLEHKAEPSAEERFKQLEDGQARLFHLLASVDRRLSAVEQSLEKPADAAPASQSLENILLRLQEVERRVLSS